MTKQLITVGHSPDPDDAFMFYALAHDKLDTGNLRFRHELQDIETLNRRALRGELEVTAVSIHAYAHLLDKYALLPSGCSMGDRYGPMVVARRPLTIDELAEGPHRRPRHADDGVPDPAAAAARRLRLRGDAVRSDPRRGGGRAVRCRPDHPRRAADLSEPGPAPGGRSGRLVAGEDRAAAAAGRQRRPPRPGARHHPADQPACSRRASATPWTTATTALDYALHYARDMDKALADRFVGMYVNDWTLDYGPRGREAVRRLLDEAHRAGVIPSPVAVEFVE